MLRKRLFSTSIAIVLLGSIACGDGGSAKNEAPIISVDVPTSVLEGASVNLQLDASDPDGSIREISWRKTYGPDIEFNGTESTNMAVFTAPEVDEDTALGVAVEVVDNDGAVSQIFSEIIITDSVKLQNIVSKTLASGGKNRLTITLKFDKEPLLNSSIDYSNFCAGGIAITVEGSKGCESYSVVQKNEQTLVLSLTGPVENKAVKLDISPSLISINENVSKSISIANIVDEKLLQELNERLSKQ